MVPLGLAALLIVVLFGCNCHGKTNKKILGPAVQPPHPIPLFSQCFCYTLPTPSVVLLLSTMYHCKNHYPKEFRSQTSQTEDSYPLYRRREDGQTAVVRGKVLDNRWVIPYNAYLLAKLDCHINVEVCSTIKAVKYLYKYIYKGHDRVAFKDSPAPIDLLVIGLHVLPKRQIRIKNGPMELQEFVVIDRSLTPAILTLWEPFVKNEGLDLASVIDQKPIFAAIRVRVVPYDGITINTKNTSSFLINPTIPQAIELRSWLYDNMANVNELLNSKSLITRAREFGKEATDAITTVSAVSTQTHLRLYNVKCTLKLLDYNQTFVFMSCNICHGKTTAAYNATYTCNHCGKPRVSTPRARVEVNVRDSSGAEQAILLGSDAEVFLGCTVSTLHENLMLPEPQPMETIIKADTKEDVFVQLRVYTINYLGVLTRKLGAFFIDAPAIVPNLGPNNPSIGTDSHTVATEAKQTVVEAEDPDLTPEEKQVLANIIARKKLKRDLLLPSTAAPISTCLEHVAAQPAIVERVACSSVSAALENAIVQSAMVEHPSDDDLEYTMSEEASQVSGTSLEGPHASVVGDDNWDQLIKDATPPKKLHSEPLHQSQNVD